MKKNDNSKDKKVVRPADNIEDINAEMEILRQKALSVLGMNPLRYESQLSETNVTKLILELEVHQVELEMQNEELRMAKTANYEATEKYTELYEFAPSGYFTLTRDGEITEVNLRGANMLGKARIHLQKSRFAFFVTKDTRPIFNKFLESVFIHKTENSCVVSLLTELNLPKEVYLNGILTRMGSRCLITMLDITDHMLFFEKEQKEDKLEIYNQVMKGNESIMMELKKEVNELLKKLGDAEKYVIE